MKIKRSASDRTLDAVLYVVFGLFSLLCVYPFYYIVINSISANNLVDLGRVVLWPIDPHLNNYAEVLKLDGLLNAAFISVLRTAVGTVLSLLSAAYMAYLFTKERMCLRKLCYRLVVTTMYFSAGLIPTYLNIRMLGLLNSFWVYVIPGMFPVFNMVLVKTYIESISPAMEESAEVDGAGYLRRFVSIVLPLSVPILATVGLFSAVGQWNAFMDTMLYVTNQKLHTLQYLLYRYFNEASTLAALASSGVEITEETLKRMVTPTAVRLTVTVIVTVPILCVYPSIQRYYVKGIMIGAVKG